MCPLPRVFVAVICAVGIPSSLGADTLPVRELTVFKDGHALVLHAGEADVDERGRVTLSHLPEPVLGTFWAWTESEATPLRSVTSGRRDVARDRPVASLAELVKANPGAAATITTQAGDIRSGTIRLISLAGQAGSGTDFFFLEQHT